MLRLVGVLLSDACFVVPNRAVSLRREFEGPFSKAAAINAEFKIKTHTPTESKMGKASFYA